MKIRSVMQNNTKQLRILHYGYEDISPDAKWGPGVRNTCIIHYVLSGRGYYNQVPLQAGQGFVIDAGELVEYHYDETEPWTYFWVIITGDLSEEICHNHISVNAHKIFSYDFSNKLLQMIPGIFSSSATIPQTEALSLFFYLLSLHEIRPRDNGNHYVSDAKNYMQLHIYQPITISEVASVLGISDRYLYNLFIQYEGCSPKQYLTELRLSHARSLLINSNYAITEIAASVGFYDVLTFSRFFSKNEGMSPTKYRQTMSSG